MQLYHSLTWQKHMADEEKCIIYRLMFLKHNELNMGEENIHNL